MCWSLKDERRIVFGLLVDKVLWRRELLRNWRKRRLQKCEDGAKLILFFLLVNI